MQSGDFFLADEISLADDSVLERLNSLLEIEKTIFIAEKGLCSQCQLLKVTCIFKKSNIKYSLLRRLYKAIYKRYVRLIIKQQVSLR